MGSVYGSRAGYTVCRLRYTGKTLSALTIRPLFPRNKQRDGRKERGSGERERGSGERARERGSGKRARERESGERANRCDLSLRKLWSKEPIRTRDASIDTRKMASRHYIRNCFSEIRFL